MIIETKYEQGKKAGYFGAFECDKCITFSLKIPRNRAATEVYMHLFADGINSQFYSKIPFLWTKMEGPSDIYEAEIHLSDIGIGLYYYEYEIISNKRFIFASTRCPRGCNNVIFYTNTAT